MVKARETPLLACQGQRNGLAGQSALRTLAREVPCASGRLPPCDGLSPGPLDNGAPGTEPLIQIRR